MTEKNSKMTLDAALKEIERLQAQNAALRGAGKANREAKNSVFLDLFKRKEYLLQLYQSLHPDDKDTSEDDLTIVTIENVLTFKHYNDLGFLRGKKNQKLLIMAEAQSSWSINILFRLWEYVIDTLMNYYINNGYDLYSTPKLEIPDVETYVIYTGKANPKIFLSKDLETDEQGRYILSLNREFFGGVAGKPELTAKVIYLKNGTGILGEYIRFSQIFDEQSGKYKEDQSRAMQEIIRICQDEGILVNYLAEHRTEVEKIMLTMVSPEYIEKAAQKTAKIQSAIEAMRSVGISEEEIKNYLVQKFEITPGYAQNCLDAEWDADE